MRWPASVCWQSKNGPEVVGSAILKRFQGYGHFRGEVVAADASLVKVVPEAILM